MKNKKVLLGVAGMTILSTLYQILQEHKKLCP